MPLWALTLLTFGVYAGFALLRHRQFGTAGYDLGIFDQAVRRYAHLQAPMVPLKGSGYNIFGDHFHPIIALAAPFYWIWDSPQTLLVVQAALIAISVPVVYRFAHRRTSSRMSLIICGSYGFSWAFQTMVNFNFHEVAFGVPLLALAIDALDRQDDRQLFLFSGALLFVREDMGVLVLLIGILRTVRGGLRPWGGARRRLPGLVLIGAGVAMYEVATGLVLPHFSPTGTFAYWQYGPTLGANLSDAAVRSLTHPWHVIDLFFSPKVKTETLLYFLLPLLLLPLRSRYSWLALPLLAQRFFEPTDRRLLWEPHYHYNALPWVVLVLAMVDGAARLSWFDRARARTLLAGVLVLVPVVLVAFVPDVAPLHSAITGKLYRLDPQMRAQAATVARIPAHVCVAADDRIAGHLTGRDWVTIPGLVDYRRIDLVVLDLSQKDVGGNLGPPAGAELAIVVRRGFHLVFVANGTLEIWQSPSYTGPSSACGPLSAGKPS
ncbi:DUF2079 domain-containing protein [Jatrophihabitans telluris]|uniref:DUF2079 domain-containing protein n=1 Tax=Jatrophihabitans telluris TaxID=2038343 RepID=A0ABY4QW13_9ACTN|nr:DUF2079 domain-containing protein [Jatrophihabitans telluris]UQX87858.1 DUF2079 domain-containing protein [Jatrophihabitans telluris]